MKVLIVEDHLDKFIALRDFVFSVLSNDVYICEKRSLRSAFKEITLNQDYDIILLDMSLPNFDVSAEEPGGGTPESYAGQELLAQMKLRHILIPVVVVTQYSQFEGGRISLSQLDHNFQESYPEFYRGTVYYNSATDSWRNSLSEIIKGVLL